MIEDKGEEKIDNNRHIQRHIPVYIESLDKRNESYSRKARTILDAEVAKTWIRTPHEVQAVSSQNSHQERACKKRTGIECNAMAVEVRQGAKEGGRGAFVDDRRCRGEGAGVEHEGRGREMSQKVGDGGCIRAPDGQVDSEGSEMCEGMMGSLSRCEEVEETAFEVDRVFVPSFDSPREDINRKWHGSRPTKRARKQDDGAPQRWMAQDEFVPLPTDETEITSWHHSTNLVKTNIESEEHRKAENSQKTSVVDPVNVWHPPQSRRRGVHSVMRRRERGIETLSFDIELKM
ncbi:hypothetical protein DFP72DRAFT_856620 [Ephemerocybe angulata]|uniref:Uncharacterized protein n=1 Tax=Ephemerocybe angulata TaxID=980116 RepID=A0A8H6HE62_9AGAR|nr:hypothetical protein DFP72DRAFT_856620 [Tulosesus angulatus]